MNKEYFKNITIEEGYNILREMVRKHSSDKNLAYLVNDDAWEYMELCELGYTTDDVENLIKDYEEYFGIEFGFVKYLVNGRDYYIHLKPGLFWTRLSIPSIFKKD